MACNSRIIKDRQHAMRREMDRRGIALKAVAFDSGIPFASLATYFPADGNKEPAQIPGGAIFALCEALPADILSLLVPTGFQIVQVPTEVDHDEIAELVARYSHDKNAAHHPDSEAGRDIGPTEDKNLTGVVVSIAKAVAA